MQNVLHTRMNRPNSCLLVRFSFSAIILYVYSLSMFDLAFWVLFWHRLTRVVPEKGL